MLPMALSRDHAGTRSQRSPTGGRIRRLLVGALLALAGLAAGSLVPGQTPPALALTPVTWYVSNNTTGQTGVRYGFEFNKPTGGNQNAWCVVATTTAPGGWSGTPTNAIGFGMPSVTASIVGAELRFVAAALWQARQGARYYLQVDGMTNTSTPGNYTVTLQLRSNSACTTNISGQNGTSSAVTFAATGTTFDVAVARQTVVSITRNTVQIGLDPTTPGLESAVVPITLGITSNATNGYTLNCRISAQPTGFTGYTSGAASATAWTSGGASQLGYALSVANNGGSGSPAPAGALSATNFAGFLPGTGETCGTASGVTGNALGTDPDGCGTGLCGAAAHAWNLVVKAAADNATPTGPASATITLVVSPSY